MRRSAFLLSPLFWLALASCREQAAVTAEIVDEDDLVTLGSNVHPLARAELEVGRSEPALELNQMILALQISSEKQIALERLLAEQQDPSSPRYLQWLTPEEFKAEFAPPPSEIARVTAWLSAHGFSIDRVSPGGLAINFSGAATNVESTFHTQIKDYRVNGRLHHANAINPSIPQALANVIAGVVTLHDFPRHPMNSGRRSAYTSASGVHALSPGDFSLIYNVKPLYASGIDGSGQTIAVVGRTHPPTSNWTTFRTSMGLPENTPQVVVNGSDPGDQGEDENGEADLDVEWSGAVAKGATIKFVISKSTSSTDGVDLSAQYIVDHNLAPVMTTSFGSCEADMGAAENTFYKNLWSQAAAQGITSFVASGDSGASGCDGANAARGSGKAVSGLASTIYNVAVGGTQFNEGSGSYWNASNGPGNVSAKGYIPEVAWNESANVSGGEGLWASGGGASSLYAKPAWQVAPGVPSDAKRDLPDVSLTAASHDGYLVQTGGSLALIGGTSASSPAFAGLMALIVQKTGQRQGNANVRFYQLAQAQYAAGGATVFHDTTSGNNSVPGTTGYAAGVGYDLATGLGSVDANALVTQFAAGSTTADFSLTAAPATLTATQGASASTTLTTANAGSFNAAISLSASGLPAGASASFSRTTIAAPGAGSATLTLSAGAATAPGSYPVTVTATSGSTTHQTNVTFNVTSAGSGGGAASDGFEAGGWTSTQVSGSAGAWTIAASGSHPQASPHGGSSFAVFNSYTSKAGNQTRIFRQAGFAVPSGAATLTFWTYHDSGYPNAPDTIQAQVSLNGSTWTSVGPAAIRTSAPSGWTQTRVDISAYAGTTVQIGFLATSAYGNDMYLDDVALTAQATQSYTLGGTITASGAGLSGVQVSAGGRTATTDASGAYTVSGLASGTYTVTPSKAGYTFSPASRSVTITSASSSGVDFSAASSGAAGTLFSDGFEDASGWSTAQVSGSAGAWAFQSAGSHPSTPPHGGARLAAFNSYTARATNQTRLFRSTGVTLPSSAASATLSFWMFHDAGYPSAADQVQAQVSTDGASWSNVGAAVRRTSGSGGWAQASVDLSAYKGQTIRIGFLAVSAYGNDMYLDDVLLSTR